MKAMNFATNLGLRVLLTVISATVVLTACGDPPPALEPPVSATAAVISPTATVVPPTPRPSPEAAPRPSPTPMPMLPTQTPAPRPSSTPAPPVGRMPAAQSPLSDQVFAVLGDLVENHSPRESATDQELDAARNLMQRLMDLGYETNIQQFDVSQPFSSVEPVSTGGSDPIESVPIGQSFEGISVGLIADVGHAFEGDIPPAGLAGRIALIERGTITFEEKVKRVAEAGATGAIIFNNAPGLFFGRLMNTSAIPALAVSQADGRALRDRIGQDDLAATITVGVESSDSRNVIADKPGTSGGGQTVILGAHYDTVANTQGASDNSSGVSAVLTIASHIANRDFPFNIRIILFGSEELGLFGSRHYVETMGQEQIDSTIAMINLDALGSGTALGVAGDDELTTEATRIGARFGLGLFSEGQGRGSSDHASFEAVGIPVLLLTPAGLHPHLPLHFSF